MKRTVSILSIIMLLLLAMPSVLAVDYAVDVTVSQGIGGTATAKAIDPTSGVVLGEGSSFSFSTEMPYNLTVTATPSANYKLQSIKRDGISLAVSDNMIVLEGRTTSENLIVSFEPDIKTYSVTVDVVETRGSVAVSPKTTDISVGEKIDVVATPIDDTYKFLYWEISPDSVVVSSNNSANASFNMPPSDVTVSAFFGKIVDVSFEEPDGGTILTKGLTIVEGESIYIEAKELDGYTFTGWTATSGTFDDPADLTTNFTASDTDTTLTANFEEDEPVQEEEEEEEEEEEPEPTPEPTPKPTETPKENEPSNDTTTENVGGLFNVQTTVDEGGRVSASLTTVASGAEISVRAMPDEGYVFDHWSADAGEFENVEAEFTSFKMPSADVVIEAHFKREAGGILSTVLLIIGGIIVAIVGVVLVQYFRLKSKGQMNHGGFSGILYSASTIINKIKRMTKKNPTAKADEKPKQNQPPRQQNGEGNKKSSGKSTDKSSSGSINRHSNQPHPNAPRPQQGPKGNGSAPNMAGRPPQQNMQNPKGKKPPSNYVGQRPPQPKPNSVQGQGGYNGVPNRSPKPYPDQTQDFYNYQGYDNSYGNDMYGEPMSGHDEPTIAYSPEDLQQQMQQQQNQQQNNANPYQNGDGQFVSDEELLSRDVSIDPFYGNKDRNFFDF